MSLVHTDHFHAEIERERGSTFMGPFLKVFGKCKFYNNYDNKNNPTISGLAKSFIYLKKKW